MCEENIHQKKIFTRRRKRVGEKERKREREKERERKGKSSRRLLVNNPRNPFLRKRGIMERSRKRRRKRKRR